MAKLDTHVFHVSEEKKRTQRDCGNRLGRTSFAQNGVAHCIARCHMHVVEFARADLGDAGSITGMLKCPTALANDDKRERAETVGRRRRPRQSDSISQNLGIK